jgi:homocysteine S-methyltransferase
MKIEDFEQRIQNTVLVADGAMGSMLFEGVGTQRCFEEVNLLQPEAVFRVHQAYIEAGANIIETNTFGANRSKLGALGLADQVTKINHRGVKIAREAREAAAHEVLIAGSIGPLAIAPEMTDAPREEMLEIYREQALALEERGVEILILKTCSYLEMLHQAIQTDRSLSGRPIAAQYERS